MAICLCYRVGCGEFAEVRRIISDGVALGLTIDPCLIML